VLLLYAGTLASTPCPITPSLGLLDWVGSGGAHPGHQLCLVSRWRQLIAAKPTPARGWRGTATARFGGPPRELNPSSTEGGRTADTAPPTPCQHLATTTYKERGDKGKPLKF